MTIPPALSDLQGRWAGSNRLFFTPTDPVHISETTALISLAALGKFLTMQYTWAHENQPQEGLLVIGSEPDGSRATAAWIDSFHIDNAMMVFQGSVTPQGGITVKRSYPAPEGPDWGW
jgi:hypothetical protein